MALRIDIITLFPEIFFGPLKSSIVGRAVEKDLVEINAVNLRDYAEDDRRTVDDVPYGGGPGMLMKADVLTKAVAFTDTAVISISRFSGEGWDRKSKFDKESKGKQTVKIIMKEGKYGILATRIEADGDKDTEIDLASFENPKM